MPWKVCKPMDERLSSLLGCWTGRRWRWRAASSASPVRLATRSSRATTRSAWTGSRIVRAGPIGMPTSCRSKSRRKSSGSNRTSQVGGHRRSGRSSPDSIRMCTPQRSAQSTRFSIAMAWSSAEPGDATGPPEQHFPFRTRGHWAVLALNMQCPAELYVPSTRPYRGLPELDYPFHDRTATVTTCGRICFNRRKINLSVVFAGQSVGIKQVSDEIWLVSFMDYDLGYFDQETCRLEPIENPFGPKVLPMSPE